MNSSNIAPDTYQLGATSAYTAILLISEGSIAFGQTYKAPSSWRKFIHTPTQQSLFEVAVTGASAARTITEGPTIIKPVPTVNELLSGPLFQVAGMFAIGEPGWADK